MEQKRVNAWFLGNNEFHVEVSWAFFSVCVLCHTIKEIRHSSCNVTKLISESVLEHVKGSLFHTFLQLFHKFCTYMTTCDRSYLFYTV